MSNKKRIIDVEEWDAWYNKLIKNLNQCDLHNTGYKDALDQIDDWMDSQPLVETNARTKNRELHPCSICNVGWATYSKEKCTSCAESCEKLKKYNDRLLNNNILDIDTGLIGQYRWERDIAINQLEQLGIGFGQNIDGIYLTKEEYERLAEYKYRYEQLMR